MRQMIYNRDAESDDFGKTVGHYDDATLRGQWEEGTYWDGENRCSLATKSQWEHEQLRQTAGGRWVIYSWSQWQGHQPSNRFVTDDEARDWLMRNEYSNEQIADIMGEAPEPERGPGQPRIGQPVKVVIPDDQVRALDAMVEAGRARTRSEAIRQVLTTALG